jgi:hypothetical protein
MTPTAHTNSPAALVCRASGTPRQDEVFLVAAAGEAPSWTADATRATRFPTMRDAMRAAVRLPGALRAYGAPAPTRC